MNIIIFCRYATLSQISLYLILAHYNILFFFFFYCLLSNEILKAGAYTHSLTKSNWNMNTKYGKHFVPKHFVPGNDGAGRKQL